jgi:prepilin-type N-terminal cleavage/methylation domain-containing protein
VKSQKGFTLIELMVVLAVGVVLLVAAVPNLVRWHQRSVSQDLASRFVDDINWSRQTALSSAQTVTFTMASDCTWSVSVGTQDAAHSLSEQQKAQSYSSAQCSSTAGTLQFAPDGLVTGTTLLTTPSQSLQVIASGTVLSQFTS